MQKRRLGTRELDLSEIALGTWGLTSGAYGPLPASATGQGAREAALEVVRRAMDLGVTTFDMAPLWGDGLAEEVVGEAGASRRGELVYVTRAGAAWKRGRAVSRFEPYDLITDCEASLRRLKTDRIDLWLLHNPPEHVLSREDWMRTGVRLKEDGKIRFWGVSVADERQAKQAIQAGADAICLVYHLLAPDDLHVIASDVADRGVGVLARSPLAYGLLAGKWPEGHTFAERDHRAQRWSPHALRTRLRQVDRLRFLSGEGKPSLAARALQYVLANKLVTSAVVGARSVQQLESAVTATDTPALSAEELAKIPEALARAEA